MILKYKLIKGVKKIKNKRKCSCESKKHGFVQGLVYGLMPHLGCIALIFFSVFGVTTGMVIFRDFLLNDNIFFGIIALSFAFATVSALIFLRKKGCLCRTKVKFEWKYLSMLYGTTIAINLMMLIVVFPILANTGTKNALLSEGKIFQLNVDIPCSGHALLITQELKKITGVSEVKYTQPNKFEVVCDSNVTKENIISLDIFKSFPAKIVGEKTIS